MHLYLYLYLHLHLNQNLYFCRTRNLLFYGLEGGKDLVVHKWRHLMDSVRVICTMLDGQKVQVVANRVIYVIFVLVFFIIMIR